MIRIALLAATLLAALSPAPATAQEPLRQATVVVGFPPGGATDVLARIVAEGLRGKYATNVTVDNRAGASGRIGVEYVKNAKNDGSVLLFTPAFPLVISPHAYPSLPYDTLRDFVPAAIAARSMMALSVGPALGDKVKTVADFVAWAKASAKPAVYGAPPGSSQHFSGQMFAKAAGIRLEHVSYKGGAPAMTDLLGGHIPANVSPAAEALPHHQAGKIRILATMGLKRSRYLPDVPTLVELGYKDVVFQDWLGVFLPAGTPPAVVARLNAAVADAVKSEAGAAGLAKLGMEQDLVTPEAFAPMVKVDWERYRGIIQAAGFKAED